MAPVTSDLATPLCDAIVAILHGNTEAQSYVGRTADFVLPFEDTGEDTPLPAYVYSYLGDTVRGGVGDERNARVELLAIADGNDARETVNKMCAVVRRALTWSAFFALGLDACLAPDSPPVQEGGAGDHEDTRGMYLMRLTLTIWCTAP